MQRISEHRQERNSLPVLELQYSSSGESSFQRLPLHTSRHPFPPPKSTLPLGLLLQPFGQAESYHGILATETSLTPRESSYSQLPASLQAMVPSLFRYLLNFLFRRPPQNTGRIPLGLPTTPDRIISPLYSQSKRRSWLDPPSLTMCRYQRMVA